MVLYLAENTVFLTKRKRFLNSSYYNKLKLGALWASESKYLQKCKRITTGEAFSFFTTVYVVWPFIDKNFHFSLRFV